MRLVDKVDRCIDLGAILIEVPLAHFNRVSEEERDAIRRLCHANSVDLQLTTGSRVVATIVYPDRGKIRVSI